MAATADAVFVGTAPTEQSEVAEIDPESGTARWHCPLPGPRVHLSSVTDESVYLNVGETVYAVDRSDGAIRWGSETNGRYVFAAAVGRDGVYVTTRGRVIGFDRATGEERWSRWLDEQVTAAPVVADGLVLVGRTGGITAFDRSGDREWTSGMVRQAVHALGTTDGTVYSTSRDLLSSFDLQSGGLRAFFDLRSSEVLEDRFPVDATVRVSVTDEVLYIAGERKVAGFDRETVEPAETWSLDKSVQWGPAVAGDLAFVTTRADGERESRTLRALAGAKPELNEISQSLGERLGRLRSDAVDAPEFVDRRRPDAVDAAEPPEQALSGFGADARNVVERGRDVVPERLVVLDGEPVGLVADALEEMELGRVVGPVVRSVGCDHQFPVLDECDSRHVPADRFERVAGGR
jgi:outer membrane protein assembly factor BamB